MVIRGETTNLLVLYRSVGSNPTLRANNFKDVIPLSQYDMTILKEDYEVFCMIAEEEIARAINSQNSYVVHLMNHVMAIVGTHVSG